MIKHIEITMQFSKTAQTIFGCKEIDTLSIFPFNNDIQIISLGQQNIAVYKFETTSTNTYFYFLDTAGTLLHFENGAISKTVNDKIKNKLINAFFEYFKKH